MANVAQVERTPGMTDEEYNAKLATAKAQKAVSMAKGLAYKLTSLFYMTTTDYAAQNPTDQVARNPRPYEKDPKLALDATDPKLPEETPKLATQSVYDLVKDVKLMFSFGSKDGGFDFVQHLKKELPLRIQGWKPEWSYIDAVNLQDHIDAYTTYFKPLDKRVFRHDHWQECYYMGCTVAECIVVVINKAWTSSQWCMGEGKLFLKSLLDSVMEQQKDKLEQTMAGNAFSMIIVYDYTLGPNDVRIVREIKDKSGKPTGKEEVLFTIQGDFNEANLKRFLKEMVEFDLDDPRLADMHIACVPADVMNQKFKPGSEKQFYEEVAKSRKRGQMSKLQEQEAYFSMPAYKRKMVETTFGKGYKGKIDTSTKNGAKEFFEFILAKSYCMIYDRHWKWKAGLDMQNQSITWWGAKINWLVKMFTGKKIDADKDCLNPCKATCCPCFADPNEAKPGDGDMVIKKN